MVKYSSLDLSSQLTTTFYTYIVTLLSILLYDKVVLECNPYKTILGQTSTRLLEAAEEFSRYDRLCCDCDCDD